MKGHLFFNTWCAAMMLAELIANVDTETDLIIVDRGLFDALVWLTMQRQRGELTADEAQTIEAFLLLDRWRTLVDLTVVMNVSAEDAMTRENSHRISNRPGSIMNREVLSALSACVKRTVQDYGAQFGGGVIEYDTSGQQVRESNTRLAIQIIDRFQSFLDPEILVVPRRDVEALPLKAGGNFSDEGRERILQCIANSGRFMQRSQAEGNSEYVQVIACGVLTYNDQVFLFERKERDPKYRLYGRATIWQGIHVPQRTSKRGIDLLKSAVLERITRSLFLSRVFPLNLVGYCWDANNPDSSQHLGVIFKVQIDNEHTAIDIRKKKFRRGRGHGLTGSFVTSAQLSSKELKPALESWSSSIVKAIKDFRGLRTAL